MPTVTSSPATGVQIKSILVATDFSPASEKPLRHAVAIARYFNANFFLMHVVSSLGFTLAGPDTTAAAVELAWRDARQVERGLVASGELAGLCHKVLVCDGTIWTELERVIEQERIDMVVIGTHSRKGLVRLVLGSVAEQIFRHASCLVLTVGPNSPADAEIETAGAARPLLFPTDFQEGSNSALPYAIALACQRRTKLVLLHMLLPRQQLSAGRWHTPRNVEPMREEIQSVSRRRLQELMDRTAACGVECEVITEFGEPVAGILRAAEVLHAEAIIIGLNRRSHVDMISHLPWSTAYETVCRAGCPVLTVRG